MPRYQNKDGRWITGVTIFTNRYRCKTDGSNKLDESYEYLKELEWGIKYISKNKHVHDNDYEQDDSYLDDTLDYDNDNVIDFAKSTGNQSNTTVNVNDVKPPIVHNPF